MPSLPVTFAEDVIDLPARAQFEAFIDEHRGALNRCLDGLTEEQARRSVVPSLTTLLGLVKHATFLEKVWFDEAVTGRSRAEIGIPAMSDESFILDDGDTIAAVQRAHREACESSRHATSSLGLEDEVYGYRLGPLPLRWVYLHVLRELAQHGGHADIIREQILTATPLPPWPARPVTHGPVVLREFSGADLPMVQELSTDPYVPLIGSLPPNATRQEAQDYIDRQRGRLAAGIGFSFAIAEAGTGGGVGSIGLWLAGLGQGRATAGYSVVPSARGRGVASAALTALASFAWTIPELHRIELYIEPWNTGSVRTAERAGFEREGLLRSHQEIGGHRRDMLLYAAFRDNPPVARGCGDSEATVRSD